MHSDCGYKSCHQENNKEFSGSDKAIATLKNHQSSLPPPPRPKLQYRKWRRAETQHALSTASEARASNLKSTSENNGNSREKLVKNSANSVRCSSFCSEQPKHPFLKAPTNSDLSTARFQAQLTLSYAPQCMAQAAQTALPG